MPQRHRAKPIDIRNGSPEDLVRRWAALWNRFGVAPPAPEHLAELLAQYSGPARHYHTLAHLRLCLATFDCAGATAEHLDEVELALWFHDAIYDPRANDNEARSAEWVARVARVSSLADAVVARLAMLVRATSHDAIPPAADAQLVCDVDLAILGASPNDFDDYEREIRAEYAFVPTPEFRARRAEILERFLARPSIYATQVFRQELEAQARLNLTRSVAALRATEAPQSPS